MTRGAASLLVVVVLSLSACGGAEQEEGPATAAAPEPEPAAAPTTTGKGVTFALHEENGSGRSGTATLDGGRKKSTIVLEVDDPSASYQSHIHDVTCPGYRRIENFNAQLATIVLSLEDVVGGSASTTVNGSLRDFMKGKSSINVHEYEEPFDVVACGDVPKAR